MLCLGLYYKCAFRVVSSMLSVNTYFSRCSEPNVDRKEAIGITAATSGADASDDPKAMALTSVIATN